MITTVYIPTIGRAGLNKQATLREFLTYSGHKPVLVCPPDEERLHRKYYDQVWSCPAKGIGPTRQWVLENSCDAVVVMADDDMRFSYRPDPAVPKLERCMALDPLLRLIEQCVKWGYIHGGVGPRQGNNHKDMKTRRGGFIKDSHLFTECDRANNFHFWHRRKVLTTGVRLDALPVMEDFHFTLSLITRGVPNLVIQDYVWNQEGSGKEGGCSLYRTAQVQRAGALGLKQAFPSFVRVVEKKSKDTSGCWKDLKTRTDVVISWQKAYESSLVTAKS